MDVSFHLTRRVDAYLTSHLVDRLEFYPAVYPGPESKVSTLSDIVAWMDLGSALADYDVSGRHCLPIVQLPPKALGLTVTYVSASTRALFVGH